MSNATNFATAAAEELVDFINELLPDAISEEAGQTFRAIANLNEVEARLAFSVAAIRLFDHGTDHADATTGLDAAFKDVEERREANS